VSYYTSVRSLGYVFMPVNLFNYVQKKENQPRDWFSKYILQT